MAVHTSLADYTAAVDAARARDASPLQDGDITTWDQTRQLLIDIVQTLFSDGIIGHSQIDDESVGVDQLIDSGPANVLPVLVAVLEGARDNNRLRYSALRDAPPIPNTETIQDIVGAMFTGGNHGGLNIAYDDPDGEINITLTGGGGNADGVINGMDWNPTTQTLTVSRSVGADISVVLTGTVGTGGTTPPSTHQRYGAYGADQTFTVADYTGGVSSMNNSMTISGATGADQYVGFWSAMPLTTIDPNNSGFGLNNIIDEFTRTRLIINSVNGYQYVSNGTYRVGLINTTWTLS